MHFKGPTLRVPFLSLKQEFENSPSSFRKLFFLSAWFWNKLVLRTVLKNRIILDHSFIILMELIYL